MSLPIIKVRQKTILFMSHFNLDPEKPGLFHFAQEGASDETMQQLELLYNENKSVFDGLKKELLELVASYKATQNSNIPRLFEAREGKIYESAEYLCRKISEAYNAI